MLDTTAEPWPPVDYGQEIARRRRVLSTHRRNIASDPNALQVIREYYKHAPLNFIRDFGITYDPRSADGIVATPFVLFRRQRHLVDFVFQCIGKKQAGLVEKSRDMGATWTCCLISVHLWLFWDGASVSWGSRKAQLVDRIGDPDAIFEKIRMQLRNVPPEFMPAGFKWNEHANHMRIVNPETGAAITGEGGDEIGRGGRSLIYFVDEAAHLEHPESVESSLNSNTDVRIDISSVGALGNVFHRRREAGVEWDPKVGVVEGRTNVLVMDWRQHPGKSQSWYDAKRQKAEDEGLLHIHAQEVDRDYAAAVQGTVIPSAWVQSAIDAHVTLKLQGDGGWGGALDVADEGGDRNALVLRRGVVLRDLQEWGARDTGVTARKAVTACEKLVPMQLQYDAIGVGAGIKAETNRLKDEKLMPRGLRLVSWNAGAGPMWPKRRVVEDDRDSPLNEEYFANLKAQGWWALRRRFELTHRVVSLVKRGRELAPTPEVALADTIRLAVQADKPEDMGKFTWSEDDLISLPSDLPLTWKLAKELSQPTMSKNTRMKLVIDKKPEGTMSPNLADAVMMAYFPVNAAGFALSDELIKRSQEMPPRKPSLAPRIQPASPSNPTQKSAPSPDRTPEESSVTLAKEEPAQFPSAPAQPIVRREIPLRNTRPPVAAVEKIGE